MHHSDLIFAAGALTAFAVAALAWLAAGGGRHPEDF